MHDLLHVNWRAVERFLDDSSLSVDETPKIVVLYGCVASGKSTLRRLQYTSGFVILDAAEVFTALGYGANDDFPPIDPTRLNLAGRTIARRAVEERRNLVIELVSNFPEQLEKVFSAADQIGYSAQLVVLECSLDEVVRRNNMRATDEISAYHAQQLHVAWLLELASGSRL